MYDSSCEEAYIVISIFIHLLLSFELNSKSNSSCSGYQVMIGLVIKVRPSTMVVTLVMN